MNNHFINRNAFPDIICFSHMRWDYVCRRPHHLMARFALLSRVYFVEEPDYIEEVEPYLEITIKHPNLFIITPCIPVTTEITLIAEMENLLLKEYFETCNLSEYIFWYYTPMSVELLSDMHPSLVVYDCVHEFAVLDYVHHNIDHFEKKLFSKASVIFTAGHALFDSKRHFHPEVYSFPNSVDTGFFTQSRIGEPDKPDPESVVIGYSGVIDDRIDLELLAGLAKARPDWKFIMVGPVEKIEESALPEAENIIYTGVVEYENLPTIIAYWDIAKIPFVTDESTKFLFPNKIAEYLAAGKPVISTYIPDVVSTYSHLDMVTIEKDIPGFIESAEKTLHWKNYQEKLKQSDNFLGLMSWDKSWNEILRIIESKLKGQSHHIKNTFSTVPKM